MAGCQLALQTDADSNRTMALTRLDPMDKQNPISVQNVTLRIPVVRNANRSLMADPFSLLAAFYMPGRTKRGVKTLIENVSFEVEEGWRLALIGRNGAGKTTLLRLLAGSFHPSRGRVVTRGTVQALLNVTLGLRDRATGFENIYLQGLAMGMHMAEIGEKVSQIVDFTELGDAIHDPIQTYSTGMRARLAFAIATSRTPNILLMDEWISTGDKFFVAKAQERVQAQVETCKALVLASHSRGIVSEICTHGLVLESGRSLYLGKIDDALKFYDEMSPVSTTSSVNALHPG
jgi:ABC-type polysaccharide/polyol phosphate transport system ATPase subunit